MKIRSQKEKEVTMTNEIATRSVRAAFKKTG